MVVTLSAATRTPQIRVLMAPAIHNDPALDLWVKKEGRGGGVQVFWLQQYGRGYRTRVPRKSRKYIWKRHRDILNEANAPGPAHAHCSSSQGRRNNEITENRWEPRIQQA